MMQPQMVFDLLGPFKGGFADGTPEGLLRPVHHLVLPQVVLHLKGLPAGGAPVPPLPGAAPRRQEGSPTQRQEGAGTSEGRPRGAPGTRRARWVLRPLGKGDVPALWVQVGGWHRLRHQGMRGREVVHLKGTVNQDSVQRPSSAGQPSFKHPRREIPNNSEPKRT